MKNISQTVVFLSFFILSTLNRNLKRVVEPGNFRIMIGASSRDIRLQDVLVVRNK